MSRSTNHWPGGQIVWPHPLLLFGIFSLLLSLIGATGTTVTNDALCGPQNGNQSCVIGKCCSPIGVCGITLDFCGDGCQPEYGGCNHALGLSTPSPPKNTTTMRHVGYYQVGQAYSRSCDRVVPEKINTANLTHLILAFVHIDATSYKVIPASHHDVSYYKRFTALQNNKLQTWVSVGGGSFSPHIWSKMIATSTNRKAFITSLAAFVKTYRFQGVDLDYEFPDPDGSDPENLLHLVHEMRDAFGSTYGISLALPNDKYTMRGFLVERMSPSVSFFNYMAYDMGGWGVNSGPKQKVMRFQSDVRTIKPDLQLLWQRVPDPRKLNLGIAYYGRGYTLASEDCLHCGCKAIGPSSPGPCTDDREGILSLVEIQHVVGTENATVSLNGDAMQKRAIWGAGKDTQWMSYDDEETVGMKLQWADAHGLGGVAFWSVDLNAAA